MEMAAESRWPPRGLARRPGRAGRAAVPGHGVVRARRVRGEGHQVELELLGLAPVGQPDGKLVHARQERALRECGVDHLGIGLLRRLQHAGHLAIRDAEDLRHLLAGQLVLHSPKQQVDDLADLLEGGDLAGGADEVLLAVALDVAGADVAVVGLHCARHVVQGEAQRDQPRRVAAGPPRSSPR